MDAFRLGQGPCNSRKVMSGSWAITSRRKSLHGPSLPQPNGCPYFAGVIGAPERTRWAKRAPVAAEVIRRRAASRPDSPSSIDR